MTRSLATLAQLWIYPLKSGRGIQLEQAAISPMGLLWDRRWMLIDESGRFLSQRELPAMARLEVGIDNLLSFEFDGRRLELPLPPYDLPERAARVWRSSCQVQSLGPEAGRWFSEQLGRPCELVFMPESTWRQTNHDFAPGKRVSFADGYPFLLCNLASLDDLNDRLRDRGQAAVKIDRFRPNLVVDHPEPFIEDDWQELSIGGIPFEAVKPCERCVIIATDQQSGAVGTEPLSTLATYRKQDGKVIFGQNLVAGVKTGLLRVGDPVGIRD